MCCQGCTRQRHRKKDSNRELVAASAPTNHDEDVPEPINVSLPLEGESLNDNPRAESNGLGNSESDLIIHEDDADKTLDQSEGTIASGSTLNDPPFDAGSDHDDDFNPGPPTDFEDLAYYYPPSWSWSWSPIPSRLPSLSLP